MKSTKIIIIISSAILLFSCKKVIDVSETDFIGGDVALKTVKNNEQGIIGAYSRMNVEMSILLNSVMADEVKAAEFYVAQTTHEWQFSSTDIGIRDNYLAINLNFQIIDRVNRVLQALPNATSTSAQDEALRTRLRGEALFMRAFAHFEMFRFYSNTSVGTELAMPYLETPSLQPQARLTVANYFQKMKADLQAAKSLLPTTVGADIYRATSLSVSGLQARVALYLKEYNDAITFSTEYINAIPLANRASFPGIWTDANNTESSFKLSRTATLGGRIGNLFRNVSANASNIGVVTWRPSDKLWNSYDQINDIRFTSYFKDETLLTSASRGSRIISKYAGTTYGTANENVADAKVFRTGEMYLIRAEARAENNDLVGAASDLNTLRSARINNYVPVVLISKDAAITEIINERFKELPFEGHRFFDAKRRNLAIIRLANDAQNTNSITLPAGNFRFVLPIPDAEMQANPLMVQNPGYN